MSQTLEIGAAYVRVSTNDQTELSPDAQIRVILDAAKADGYIIPPEFIFVEHRGISGRKAENRTEFLRMISIAKCQNPAPFKRLYLWKFSRFARNQEESIFYKGILRKKCGIEVKSVSEPLPEGMFGRLIETIIEWFDEYYSINLSGEVLRGMTEKALRNGYQAVPSLGYRAIGGGQPFVIQPDKMEIAEFIHISYHNGLDMTAVSREANRRGYRTNRGQPFERRTVLRILTNKFYIGTVTWNGISFQGTHELNPAIVAVFDENQKRIEQEYRPVSRRQISSCKHWLSGLLKCGICGASLSLNKSHDISKRGDTFQCWKYAKGSHHGSNSISVRKAEAAILESLQAILDTGQIEYEFIPPKDTREVTEETLLQETIAKLEYKEQRIREAYEAGIDTLEEYRANKLRIADERQQLQSELLQQQEQSQSGQAQAPNKNEVLARIQVVYNLLSDPDVDFEVKGNAIRQVVKEIIYDRQTKEFRVYYYA